MILFPIWCERYIDRAIHFSFISFHILLMDSLLSLPTCHAFILNVGFAPLLLKSRPLLYPLIDFALLSLPLFPFASHFPSFLSFDHHQNDAQIIAEFLSFVRFSFFDVFSLVNLLCCFCLFFSCSFFFSLF